MEKDRERDSRGIFLRHRLAGTEIDPNCAKVGGAALLRRASEDILAPRNFKLHKTGRGHGLFELCFQQSTGNSTGP
jgi:hypothetical protein